MSATAPVRATPRSLAWMTAQRDRYLTACATHRVDRPLDRFQQLERNNADYWTRRIEEETPT